MIGTEMSIGNYAVEKFIGYGASSAVFRGYDIKCKSHGVSKNVAIKFIWDREMALEEVKRLEQTHSVFEICDLITYDEVSGAQAREILGDILLQLEKALENTLPIAQDEPVGVLILKLINGEHLIDRAIYDGSNLDSECEWTVNFEHPVMGERIVLKEWLTQPARKLGLEARLEIMLQLAKAVDESHRSGVVHGDLNPWNVFYDPESGRISIIDLGRNNFGVQGWRAPEHCQLMLEEIETLPPSTDVWLLGQWMLYLLPKKGPWSAFTKKCLSEDARDRPSLKDMIKALKAYLHPRPKRSIFAMTMLFCLALFVGIYAIRQNTPFSLEVDSPNRIAVFPYKGSHKGGLVAEMVSKTLNTAQYLDTVSFSHSKTVAQTLANPEELDLEGLQKASRALGAQFFLTGRIDEADSGSLKWTGVLYQINGARRGLTASGQNPLILADNIAHLCLRLIGTSDEMRLPTSDFYSGDLNASFLFSYGNDFLNAGDIKAATSMYEEALKYDPDFIWASAKLGLCLIQAGELSQGQEILEDLIARPDVLANPYIAVSTYGYLAEVAWARSEYTRAAEYVEEAKLLCETHDLKELLANVSTLESRLLLDQGLLSEAKEIAERASTLYEQVNDRIGYLLNLDIQIQVDSRLKNFAEAREKQRKGLDLARHYGLENYEAIMLVRDAFLDIYDPDQNLDTSTLEKLQLAQSIHIKLGNKNLKQVATYLIAFYYQRINEFEKAGVLARELLLDAQESGFNDLFQQSSLLLADIALTKGRIDETELLLRPLVEGENRFSPTSQIYALGRLWKIYAERGEYQEALACLERFLNLAKELRQEKHISYAYNNIGEVHEKQGAFKMAGEYYNNSLVLKRKLNDLRGISWTLRNLVVLSIKQGNLNDADTFMSELLQIDRDDFQNRIVKARLHYEYGEFDTAFDILTQCKQEAELKGRWHKRLESFYQIFEKASAQNRYFPLPEQFGNWL